MTSLLEFRFTGQLRYEQHEQPTTGTISVARDGVLHATFDPLQISTETAWLFAAFSDGGRTAPWLDLKGTTADGKIFHTEHLVLTSRGTSSGPDGPATLTLEGHLSRLTLTYESAPTTSDMCSLVYHTIGMRGFGQQHASTAVGALLLWGQTDIENHDEIAGRMHLTAPPSLPLDEWLNRADDAIEHILRIVSLAEGKPLFWSIRELYDQNTIVRTDLTGPHHTGNPEDNTFHFLNLQPVLDLAANNYTPVLRNKTGIRLAIDLFLTHPPHLEIRLITAMTALEHLVSVHDKHNPPTTPLDKPTFSKLNKELLRAYDAEQRALQPDEDLRERLQRVRSRIGNLNHLTFKDRLWHMLTAYAVPLTGIADRINPAIDARNDIVHTGMHDAPFTSFHLHVTILRELLKRTFLTLLKYEGQYQSYLNGPEWIAFPPKNITVKP